LIQGAVMKTMFLFLLIASITGCSSSTTRPSLSAGTASGLGYGIMTQTTPISYPGVQANTPSFQDGASF